MSKWAMDAYSWSTWGYIGMYAGFGVFSALMVLVKGFVIQLGVCPTSAPRSAGTLHIGAGTLHIGAGTWHIGAGTWHIGAGTWHIGSAGGLRASTALHSSMLAKVMRY